MRRALSRCRSWRRASYSAAFLAFITSFDELVVAMFISGANMTLPKKMFRQHHE